VVRISKKDKHEFRGDPPTWAFLQLRNDERLSFFRTMLRGGTIVAASQFPTL